MDKTIVRQWKWDEALEAARRRRQKEVAALVQPRPSIAQRLRMFCARRLRINFKRARPVE